MPREKVSEVEGFYPRTPGLVLVGDVDRDGTPDLVVLDPNRFGEGGVHVLHNRLGGQTTVVEERRASLPERHVLEVAYPNPFNPGAVLPFRLGGAAEKVQVVIYNAVGQVVRRLELGSLGAGAHRVEWDGQDEAGRVLSSGRYVYRLEADGWSATGKVVKTR